MHIDKTSPVNDMSCIYLLGRLDSWQPIISTFSVLSTCIHGRDMMSFSRLSPSLSSPQSLL